MTTFYLIRHGERDTPPDVLPGRSAGIRLTERGREQAELIARRLASERVDLIYSSPLERAVETAGPLARDKHLAVELAPEFNELDAGLWTGRTFADLQLMRGWGPFNTFRSGSGATNGELALDVQYRFVGELLRLRGKFPHHGIACFSHQDSIRFALLYFLGMSLDHFQRIEISVGSISVLELSDIGACLVRLNEVPQPEWFGVAAATERHAARHA